jgi:hypothetical protein
MISLVRAAMSDLMPSTEDLPGVDRTDLTEFLRALRRESTRIYWLGVVLGSIIYTLTPVLTVGWPVPAFILPARLRDRHAEGIVGSNLYLVRQSVFLLRLSAGMCWGMHPLVRERLALPPYPGDPGTVRSA